MTDSATLPRLFTGESEEAEGPPHAQHLACLVPDRAWGAGGPVLSPTPGRPLVRRPRLVSLDLSFNNLMDLEALMAALRSLQHLRLLVLQGNPLALVAHYRGFTIDSLAPLCVLDDLTVSPSEKYQFRGLGFEGGEESWGLPGLRLRARPSTPFAPRL